MQMDLPDDALMRETIASLGPAAKDFTLDDLATWIRQLEGLCDSQDAALATASFRTDINGSCLSKFPASGTSAERSKVQTKAVKGFAPLPELHMEKVSTKKNARGEAKLSLSVERGQLLVLLTITDLDGATRTLRAVTTNDNDLIPIKHAATTIEATAIPFAPKQLLERLRNTEAKLKEKREQHVQPRASPQPVVEEASAQRQADRVEYSTKRFGSYVISKIVDRETGTVTFKSSGCSDPNCDDVNCTEASTTLALIMKNGEMNVDVGDPQLNDVLASMLKGFDSHPQRVFELHNRKEALLKEVQAIHEKLPTAKPAEKKRLNKELENKNAEYAKLTDLMFCTAAGGWLRAPKEELDALVEKAKLKDPNRVAANARQVLAAFDEYTASKEKLESTSNRTKKKRLSSLLARKENEFDAAMNEIAAIALGSEQGHGTELNDVSIRMNGALIPSQSP
ncbi:hypothetical protein AAVH_20052 [Aphelenchoides avenae]|nr:hypothetical protein AAVH_20052 [Aphelenchus avenae]